MTIRVLAALALSLTLPAADGPSPEPRMVDLNVVAVDNHGQPVTDLTPAELRVTDSGRPQTISFFRFRDSRHTSVPQLGPNEFSNRSAGNVPRATLILFDQLNETFSTRGVAANNLIRSLAALEAPDYVYLYFLTVTGQLYPVHGLPGQDAEPGQNAPWTSRAKPLIDQALRAVMDFRPQDVDVAVRVQLTYSALDAIAAQLSRVPGRKNIVWITDGVPIELGPNHSDTGENVDFTPLLRQMSEAFDRSGVAIYPVRQIMLGSPDTVGHTGASGIGSIDTLDEFAGMTGGRPDAGKDIDAALRQAINDARTSYQLGYYPPEKNWDNKYHKLRIACTRKGVRIQAKTAYYAWRDAPGSQTEQAIGSVIGASFDAAEIGIRATLLTAPSGGKSVRLDAHIDAQDVALSKAGDGYDGELRMAVVGYRAGEPPRPGELIPLPLHYSAQALAAHTDIHFVHDLSTEENLRLVRLIVFDRGSRAIGSLTLPVPGVGGGR